MDKIDEFAKAIAQSLVLVNGDAIMKYESEMKAGKLCDLMKTIVMQSFHMAHRMKEHSDYLISRSYYRENP